MGEESQLDLVPAVVSPLDLHLDVFIVTVGELRNIVSRSIQEPELMYRTPDLGLRSPNIIGRVGDLSSQKRESQLSYTIMEKPLSSDISLNTPLVEVGGRSPLDLVSATISPLDLHLDAFTIGVG